MAVQQRSYVSNEGTRIALQTNTTTNPYKTKELNASLKGSSQFIQIEGAASSKTPAALLLNENLDDYFKLPERHAFEIAAAAKQKLAESKRAHTNKA